MPEPAYKRFLPFVSALAVVLTMNMTMSGNAAGNTAVRFSGVIDSISVGYEIPGMVVGDTVSGVLTFNPATTDDQPL